MFKNWLELFPGYSLLKIQKKKSPIFRDSIFLEVKVNLLNFFNNLFNYNKQQKSVVLQLLRLSLQLQEFQTVTDVSSVYFFCYRAKKL